MYPPFGLAPLQAPFMTHPRHTVKRGIILNEIPALIQFEVSPPILISRLLPNDSHRLSTIKDAWDFNRFPFVWLTKVHLKFTTHQWVFQTFQNGTTAL